MFNILVIDDDKNARYLMHEILEGAGYHVLSAENGAKAFDIMENNHIDLVIVDIMMPVINGYEFTSSIREFNKELPILMISAKQSSEDRKKGFKLGIDDYMSKPIDNEELLLHIKALLRRANMLSEKKLQIGDVVLDYDSLTVSKNDEIYELPQKEFYLLFKLLSYPNKIFTRIQLMDEIWGLDCETSSDTLSVHILRLRKRFENWDEFRIESIRGLGYKAVKNV